MKHIIITTTGNITPKCKEKLTKNGILVIECNDPSQIKMASEIEIIAQTNNHIMMAAMQAIHEGTSFISCHQIFQRELNKRLKADEIERSKKA